MILEQMEDGRLVVTLELDKATKTRMISDFIPKSLAEIKHFVFCLTGITQVMSWPDEYKLVEPFATLDLYQKDREERRAKYLEEQKIKEQQEALAEDRRIRNRFRKLYRRFTHG